MKLVKYENGVAVETVGVDGLYIPKTTYSTEQFLNVLKPWYRAIKTAALDNDGTDSDDIEFWLDLVPSMTQVDLNNLPVWFVDGIQSMVNKGIITQAGMDNFLER